MLSVNVDNLFDKTIVIDILLTVGMFEKEEEFDVNHIMKVVGLGFKE